MKCRGRNAKERGRNAEQARVGVRTGYMRYEGGVAHRSLCGLRERGEA
jgi:hypothetical protein